MATNLSPEEAASTAGAVPASNPLPPNALGEPEENEDEWEYEYSKTETEVCRDTPVDRPPCSNIPRQTYYLPIDFSIPQFARRYRQVPSMTRGGSHYRNWTGLEHQKRPEMKHHRLHSDEDDDDLDNGDGDLPLPESEDDDEGDETMAGPSTKTQGDQDDDENAEPDELQVLDLHSEKPLFRYRKRIFEGSWSRVLGTELLFAERLPPGDPDPRMRPLPSIRSLPGDVDLLAACWSHITTSEVELHPHQKEESPVLNDPYEDIKRARGIQIPIWSDKTGERADQTRFLEDLMALKLKKGEKDAVTVYAQAPDGLDRVVGQRTRARGIYSGRGRPPGRPRASRNSTRELLGLGDDEDLLPDGKKRRQPLPDSRPVKMRRPYGTGPRAMQSRARAGLMARPLPVEAYDESSTSDEDDSMLSQPTPGKWSDLEQGAEEEEPTSSGDTDDDDDDDDDDDELDEDEGVDTVMANAT